MNNILNKKLFFGTWNIEPNIIDACVKGAIEAGFELIDTATIYGNEKEVGDAVQKYNKEFNKQTLIQSKMWCSDFSNPEQAFQKALQNLHTNKIFSYMLHRPTLNFADTVKAWKFLVQMKNENKIEHLGVSNFDKDMIEILYKETKVYPEFNQIEVSVHNLREDRITYCKNKGIGIQAYSPLGNTVLQDAVVIELSQKYKSTPAQIALAYLLNQDFTVICKSVHPQRMTENLQSLNIKLNPEEINRLKKQNTFDNHCVETFPTI